MNCSLQLTGFRGLIFPRVPQVSPFSTWAEHVSWANRTGVAILTEFAKSPVVVLKMYTH